VSVSIDFCPKEADFSLFYGLIQEHRHVAGALWVLAEEMRKLKA